MFFLSSARGGGAVDMGIVMVKREGSVRERYGHLAVVREGGRQGDMVIPEGGGRIGELERMGMDRGGR